MANFGKSTTFAAIGPRGSLPIASYIANEPIRDERTSKSGRNGRICGGTLNIGNVGINKEKQLMQCALRALLAVFLAFAVSALPAGESRVATFSCDVTPPLGAPMFCGDALRTIEEPLQAKGIVIESGGQRYVLCAIDWCLLSNGSYQTIREKIAAAAQTEPSRVAVQTVHQHTAPMVDMDAQKLLVEIGDPTPHMAPKALETIEQRLVAAVQQSLDHFEPFDHVGVGQAPVDRVASTRRFIDTAGHIHGRSSSCKDPAVTALPEGIIDPYLKTITLARGQKPLVRLHYYATHPQSRYGDGRATSDFAGIARERLQQKEGVFQVYFNGCGGDVAAGKYNDGSDKCRKELTERLQAGMEASVAATKLSSLGAIQWRSYPLVLPRRSDAGFTMNDCLARMKDPKSNPVAKLYLGAMRAASLRRADQPIELTSPANRRRAYPASARRAADRVPVVRPEAQTDRVCRRGRLRRRRDRIPVSRARVC